MLHLEGAVYVLRLGFLDGKEGLIFHFLQGCWYRYTENVGTLHNGTFYTEVGSLPIHFTHGIICLTAL